MPLKALNVKKPRRKETLTELGKSVLSQDVILQQLLEKKSLNRGEFVSRYQKLRRLRFDLIQLGQSEEKKRIENDEFDLPQMSHCTEHEKNVCRFFIKKKLDISSRLLHQASILQKLVIGIVSGRYLTFMMSFYLSRVRRLLDDVEKQENALEHDQGRIEKSILSLKKSFQSPHHEELAQGSKFVLRTIFEKMENGSEKIANLKTSIEQLESEIQWMKEWISFEEVSVKGKMF